MNTEKPPEAASFGDAFGAIAARKLGALQEMPTESKVF
jgi:hypothetical protein